MTDLDSTPLTDEERAELEQLRAEKARREREELEALRAEASHIKGRAHAGAGEAPKAESQQQSKREADAVSAAAQRVPGGAGPAQPQRPAASPAPVPTATSAGAPSTRAGKEARSFGERMVLSSGEDEDGLPTMPMAQKLIIGICLVAAIAVVVYLLTR